MWNGLVFAEALDIRVDSGATEPMKSDVVNFLAGIFSRKLEVAALLVS